jgi:phosphatidylglycerol:prolipoprotein diacylglycerol transferase
MPGPFVHNIDPIIGTVAGVHLWWYGLSYTAGFVNAFLFLRRRRRSLGLSNRSLYSLVLLLAGGVLLGGRSLVVFSNEWSFYRDHPALIPAVWTGGLATHGLIVGGAAGVMVFCLAWRRPFRPIFDVLAVAAAVILGFGRIGNFIDGQIVGSLTTVPWAVRFPDADGWRHPVVLYDGLKNFLLVPLLIWVERRGAPAGRVAALFVFLYAALRIPIDLLRDYPITTLGLPTGQAFNVIMATIGLALVVKSWWSPGRDRPPAVDAPARPGWRRWAFCALLLFAMVIPSDATRDVPERYGHRHAGLEHSALYPDLPDDLSRR